MGVPGLWDVLRPACKQRSLTHLAVVDGFEGNPAGRRGLRVGIDASIWFYHATYGKEGENPELRTMFFRCARLMNKPLLPLFVFDGPKRPSTKRKKKVSGKDHWLTSGMQRIIEAFGFEWRMAPGEAEAELAYLNRIGVIDAIISDDVDTFVFGAVMIIRNPSKTLSGNTAHPVKNSAGKEDDEHVNTFNSKDFANHPEINLSIGGLILIALLRGGDYDPEGLSNFGVNVAHGLARCGFGDTLLEATRNLSRTDLESFLVNWRNEIRLELRTNSRGYLGTKKMKLAQSVPDSFPDIDTLLLYTNPVTSESERRSEKVDYTWNREPDLGKLGGICEWFFEWGVREIIIKRFRTVMWAPIVLRILRRSTLREDDKGTRSSSCQVLQTPKRAKPRMVPKPPGTPSTMIARHFSTMHISQPESSDDDDDDADETRLIVKIHSKREHASTDGVPEYRLEINPTQLISLTEAGIEGKRKLPEKIFLDDDSDLDADEDDDAPKSRKKGPKKPPPDPNSNLRVWMPACMVKMVEPELVRDFEELQEAKQLKKANAAERKALKAQGLPVPKTKAKANSKVKSSGSTAQNGGKKNKLEPPTLGASETDEEDVFSSPLKSYITTSNRLTETQQSTSRPVLQTIAAPQDDDRPAHKGHAFAPFPMSLSDVDSDEEDGSNPSGPLGPFEKLDVTSAVWHKQPRYIPSAESSEGENHSPKKSPRKSLKQKSVLGIGGTNFASASVSQKVNKRTLASSFKPLTAIQRTSTFSRLDREESEESDLDERQRPSSPSPLRNVSRKNANTRGRLKTSTTVLSGKSKTSTNPEPPVEIIEISSDSDDARVPLESARFKNLDDPTVRRKRSPPFRHREVIELSSD